MALTCEKFVAYAVLDILQKKNVVILLSKYSMSLACEKFVTYAVPDILKKKNISL